ncbi:NTF2-related export protein [Macrobrachium rosenbergii]|uniref:NTF2-related export protein n=1 Tax=Macrobrachium rosenbergii TaxID=79674 RepID=UPI0034D3C53F
MNENYVISSSLVNKLHEMAAVLEADRMKILTACTDAESFTKIYYEFLDKSRHKLNKLYLDEGKLVWNGNVVEKKENIQKFFEELPTSTHTITSLDSQPVNTEAVGSQATILVTTAGFVVFKNRKSPFQQSFILTAKDDKWKLVSDVFRFQDQDITP